MRRKTTVTPDELKVWILFSTLKITSSRSDFVTIICMICVVCRLGAGIGA